MLLPGQASTGGGDLGVRVETAFEKQCKPPTSQGLSSQQKRGRTENILMARTIRDVQHVYVLVPWAGCSARPLQDD